MSKSPAQVSSDILSTLSITAPGLSCEIGTPERYIIDSCAEAISESYMDTYILNAQMDLDTMSGVALEQFVGIFGFGRLQGTYSTGVVTFSLGYTATQDMQIPSGTQVYIPSTTSVGTGTLFYNTTQTVVISQGTSSVDAPAQCTVIGSQGNAPSNTITGFGTGTGAAMVTNLAPFANGTDTESDDHLRQRFKATIFRNIAGTQDFYTGMMLQSTYTTRVTVIGPYNTWTEQLQFNGTSKIFSTNPDCKYVWPGGWFLYNDLGLSTETFYVSASDYVVDPTVDPPGITPSNPQLTATGAVADFEYQYTSTVSRNDPANGITNVVDVFIDGQQSIEVDEYAPSTATTFNTTSGSIYNINNFLRDVGGNPVSGNRFQQLGSAPVVTFPGVIYGPVVTYVLGTDYHGVTGITLSEGSNREVFGIEWITVSPPSVGDMLTMTYAYNRLPELMTSLLGASKQIGTDVLVHQATYKAIYVYATIVYDLGTNITSTNANINAALTMFFDNLTFGAWVQFSDLIQQIHNVTGVDNVRISTLADVGGSGSYGVAWRINGVVQTDYSTDFKLNDNEIPTFDGLSVTRRGSNTF